MNVSALIITYNDTSTLQTCFESLLAIKHLNEVLIFNNFGYVDQTEILSTIHSIGKEHSIKVTAFKSTKDESLAVAYNWGIRHSKNNHLFIIHADCQLMSEKGSIDFIHHMPAGTKIMGFPIIEKDKIKGIFPLFQPKEISRINYALENEPKTCLDHLKSGPLPALMPQAFVIKTDIEPFDENYWYALPLFNTIYTHRKQYQYTWFEPKVRINHYPNKIRRNRSAASNEWKKREYNALQHFRKNHQFRSLFSMELWFIFNCYILFFKWKNCYNPLFENWVFQSSLLIAFCTSMGLDIPWKMSLIFGIGFFCLSYCISTLILLILSFKKSRHFLKSDFSFNQFIKHPFVND